MMIMITLNILMAAGFIWLMVVMIKDIRYLSRYL